MDRSIQIQGDDASLGCQVLLALGSQTILQGVGIKGCGQLASGGAALRVEGAQKAAILDCALLDSKAAGISAKNTVDLQLEGNVIVSSIGSSVSILNSSNAR